MDKPPKAAQNSYFFNNNIFKNPHINPFDDKHVHCKCSNRKV